MKCRLLGRYCHYQYCECDYCQFVIQSLVGLQNADKTKTHPQTKLQNGEMHPLLPETTISRYRRNNQLIIGRYQLSADYWCICIHNQTPVVVDPVSLVIIFGQ